MEVFGTQPIPLARVRREIMLRQARTRIAELEGAKEDADNAADYWSDPTDAEDCRVYCESDQSDTLVRGNSAATALIPSHQNSQIHFPTITPGLQDLTSQGESPEPEIKWTVDKSANPFHTSTSATANACIGAKTDDLGAGCYLVFEVQNQGTLTATWSQMTPE